MRSTFMCDALVCLVLLVTLKKQLCCEKLPSIYTTYSPVPAEFEQKQLLPLSGFWLLGRSESAAIDHYICGACFDAQIESGGSSHCETAGSRPKVSSHRCEAFRESFRIE